MKRVKVLLCALMIMCMALGLVGCGNRSGAGNDGTVANSAGNATNSSEDVNTERTVTVNDMAGRDVTIKGDVNKVVIIEWEAMASKTMKIMGIADQIVGIDDYAAKNTFRNYIIPEFKNAKDIGSAWSGVNYEALAALKPDVVFLELWVTSDEEKQLHDDCIKKIEDLGIPVVCFLSPSCYDEPNIETAWEHITLVGKVLGREAEAEKIIANIKEKVDLIKQRTKDLTEDEKKDVLIFASANNVLGTGTVQSYFLTDIVNANNLAGSGDFIKISEEELLNYNPEKLIIAGHDGYISPETVKAGKSCGINWGNVKDLEAIKNDEFICLGYEEWRDTIETPVTLLKMAKLVYPELFEDIDIEKEEKELYMNCYGLTEDQVAGALDAQHYTGQLEEAK